MEWMSSEWFAPLVMFVTFVFFIFSGTPISFAIGLSTIITGMLALPWDITLVTAGQKAVTGLDNF